MKFAEKFISPGLQFYTNFSVYLIFSVHSFLFLIFYRVKQIVEFRMEDELEEKVLQQACLSQMKFLSKFSFNLVTFFNRSSGFSNVMRFILRPEVLFFAILLFVVCFYLQALELNGFVSRISRSLNFASRPKISFATTTRVEGDSWEEVKTQSAVFAIQGRRPKMEDR